MDSVVKVHRSFLNRIRGFCNIFASMCSDCFRHPCSCSLYDEIKIAKGLICEIDTLRDADEERFYIENPAEELFARIEKALEQAGKPIRSNEIYLEGECRQRKARALKALVKRNRIVRTVVDGTPFYCIKGDALNTNNNKTNIG